MADMSIAPTTWHTLSGIDLAGKLGVDPNSGLSSADIDQRLQQNGANVPSEKKKNHFSSNS